MRGRAAVLGWLVVAGLVAVHGAAAQQAGNKGVEDEVIRVTRAAWAADMQRNGAEAGKNIANDYTEFNGDYSTRLEGKDLAVRLNDANYKSSGKLLAADMINPKVQVYGDVAILSYNYVGVAQNKDGETEPVRAKSTRVYVKKGNDWMLVHANFAPDPLPRD